MKALLDPGGLLLPGLAHLREELDLPEGFPSNALAEARESAARRPANHRDRTAWPFVTLDPASSTDLDQAFHIEKAGGELLLHYAIADVGWFVRRAARSTARPGGGA